MRRGHVCACVQVTRVAAGKYLFGEEMKNPVMLRITRASVMVRVGGGWDTLERYLQMSQFRADHTMLAFKKEVDARWAAHRKAPQVFKDKRGRRSSLYSTIEGHGMSPAELEASSL